MTGKVRTINLDKGYGFILADTGKDYFFHHTALQGFPFTSLYEGIIVTFEEGNSPKGLRAENVEVVE